MDEHPALRNFDFVRAHDMPEDRVYVFKGRPYAALQDVGTPAGYPHKRATKLTDLVSWGEQED